MSNKPNQKPSLRKAEAEAKAPRLQHLNNIKAMCAVNGVTGDLYAIDLILNLDKALTERGGAMTIDDATAIGVETLNFHKP